MAKKSKTQRAKASARRAEKREAAENAVATEAAEGLSEGADAAKKSAGAKTEKVKVIDKASTSSSAKKAPKKEPGAIVTFFRGVRSELARVTWPSREDVMRWSGVVVGALLFFGVFVFILDNIFPQLLVLLDSINASGADSATQAVADAASSVATDATSAAADAASSAADAASSAGA